MTEQLCPVCLGVGTVHGDFYTQLGVSTNTMRATCRRCGGLGTISTSDGPCLVCCHNHHNLPCPDLQVTAGQSS